MSRHHRRGFTLVELLVVITIIGMLMGLLLPALAAIRSQMQSAACAANMKNVSLALLRYEGANKYFPGFTNRVGPNALPTTLTTGTQEKCIEASWVVMLLADLDRPDLWEVWSRGQDYKPTVSGKTADDDRNRFMKVLTCPANPPERQGQNDTPLAYVVNCGTVGVDPTPREAFGIFHDRGFEYSNKRRIDHAKVSLDYIRGNDGVGQTLLMSENVNSGSWAQQNAIYWGGGYQGEDLLGFVWHWDDKKYPVVNHINLDIRRNHTDSSIKNGLHARPSSFHTGGVNVAFCDGRQHWLREDIDIQVYWHLMTPNSRGARVSGILSQGVPGTISETQF